MKRYKNTLSYPTIRQDPLSLLLLPPSPPPHFPFRSISGFLPLFMYVAFWEFVCGKFQSLSSVVDRAENDVP